MFSLVYRNVLRERIGVYLDGKIRRKKSVGRLFSADLVTACKTA